MREKFLRSEIFICDAGKGSGVEHVIAIGCFLFRALNPKGLPLVRTVGDLQTAD
jgi:hypothetical protein